MASVCCLPRHKAALPIIRKQPNGFAWLRSKGRWTPKITWRFYIRKAKGSLRTTRRQ